MYSFELHQVTVKKSPENAASAFYDALYAENWARIMENPFFHKSRDISKLPFQIELELGISFFFMKLGQVIATNGAKCYISLFQNFPFLAQLPQILVNFGQK